MKLFRAVALVAFTLVAAHRAAGAPSDSKTNSAGFAESDLIETWGWLIAQQEEVTSIEVNRSELRWLMKGFSSGIHGGPAPCDLSQVNPDVERLRKARRAKQVRAIEKRNEREARAFFKALKKNPRVAALPGGVNYEIIQPGNGVFPAPRQTVNVHFTAHLLDGTEFAQLGPMDMVLVTNHAPFAAWVAGLQKIKTGGAIRFYVPPPMPEKEALRWGIPRGSAMVFDAELLKVRDTTEQELADEFIAPAPELELPASGFSTAVVFEAWGWTVAQKTRAAQFNLSETELSALADGMQSGIAGRSARADLERIRPAVETFVNDHREQVRVEAKRKQLVETEALFAELKRNTNVVELADGLRYEILQPGTGPFPQSGQLVKVNYTGRLIDGRIFDRTDPSLGPLDIKVGSVITGWSEGVQKINRGGKIKLYIPPALAYGDVSTGGIPSNSVLIFEIELLDIKNSVD